MNKKDIDLKDPICIDSEDVTTDQTTEEAGCIGGPGFIGIIVE